MKNYIFVMLILIFFSRVSLAKEISLLEETMVPQSNSVEIDSQSVDEEDYDEAQDDHSMQKNEQEDEFEKIDEFIRKENEKVKDIKLLNLDLEKAGLILKKKEIDQKIDQLRKAESSGFVKTNEHEEEAKLLMPNIRLVSIFASASLKRAVLNINGVNNNVKEGQKIGNVIIANINSENVMVKYSDGQTEEISFL